MDRIKDLLIQADSLNKQNNHDASYFCYLEVAFTVVDLLFKESFQNFEFEGDFGPEGIERLFGLAFKAIEFASNRLDTVIDLSSDEAEMVLKEGLLAATPKIQQARLRRQSSALLSGTLQSVAGKDPIAPPFVQVDLERGPNLNSNGNLRACTPYGSEPPLSDGHLEELPTIPASNLALSYCQHLYELQIVLQKIELLRSGSAKQKGNGLYLQGLKTALSSLEAVNKNRIEVIFSLNIAENTTVIQIPPEDLAKQITLIQTRLLKRIEKEELLIPLYGDEAYQASNLRDFMNLNKYLSHWVQYEVLRYEKENDRAVALIHLVKVADKLFELYNYDGMRAVVDGLSSRAMKGRLLRTWELVNRHFLNRLDSLERLVTPEGNYRYLRAEMNARSPPTILSMALFLYDRQASNGTLSESALARFEEFKESHYEEIYREKPIVQHYILAQPFRWEEELDAMAKMREPRVSNQRRVLAPPPMRSPKFDADDDLELVRRSLSHQYLCHQGKISLNSQQHRSDADVDYEGDSLR